MPTLLFGSISTLADTSELQRASFNHAFDEAGLDWNWDLDAYAAMLVGAGGALRVADYAESRGETVDAAAVREAKTRIFQEKLRRTSVPARSGGVDTVRAARSRGDKVGFVTTTAPENVSTLLDALGPDLGRDSFDVVVDASKVPRGKPDADAYTLALSALGVSAERSVAVEGNVRASPQRWRPASRASRSQM